MIEVLQEEVRSRQDEALFHAAHSNKERCTPSQFTELNMSQTHSRWKREGKESQGYRQGQYEREKEQKREGKRERKRESKRW